jgi:MerR family transcriptional regulator, redox-sensitive transcriptional activator SoxR
MVDQWLTIGECAERTGVSTSALRYYERERLVTSTRTSGGQRRFHRDALRRIAFVRIAQRVGLTLEQIRDALATLPDERTPTQADWARLSKSWRPQLDEQIAVLERLRDQLTSCIGCGCLSLRACALYNRDDAAAQFGSGPRYLLDEETPRTS